MNADMIPGMLYEEHGFEFKMRCLKGIILESGKADLIKPIHLKFPGILSVINNLSWFKYSVFSL